MKTWVKVLLGVVGVIGLSVAGAFYFTSGATRAGDDFFAAVGAGDMDRTYGTLSSAFRAATSEAELAAFLAANRMDKVADTSWGSRSVSGGRGSLVGTLTTTAGESIPVEIDLIKEEDRWKIYALRDTAGAAGVGYGAKGLPGENEQVALVAESMGIFADAVAAGSMKGLHDHISRLWAGQFDVAKLDDAFKSFYRFGPGLQVVKTLPPVFDGPARFSDENVMAIAGYYPTDPDRVHFTLKYIYEGTGWKLFGVSVDVK